MPQYTIDIGAAANDGTGDPLRTAFNEVNLNFDQVFAAGPVLSNVRIANNTILTTTTNGNLILAPNGVGVVQSNVHIVPNASNIRNLGSATQRWSTVYVQYANVSGELSVANLTATGDVTVGGNLSVTGNVVNIGNIITDAKTIQLANTASTANAATGSGITVGANDAIATFLFSSSANAWTTNIAISAVGNITAPYFIGNGSQLTGIVSSYGNTNVATFLANFGSNTISTTGTVNTGNLAVTGNITANSSGNVWSFNGSKLNAPSGAFWNSQKDTLDEYISSAPDGYIDLQSLYANSNVASQLHLEHGLAQIVVDNGGTYIWEFDSSGNLTLPGNTFAVNYANGSAVSLSGTYGNANVVANLAALGSNPISTTGNITANYFVGNGSQLTGIVSSYGNANVANYLPTFSGNISAGNVSASGNITGGNLISPTLNNSGNISVVAGGNTWTFGSTGNLTLPGNIIAINYLNGNRVIGNVTFSGEAVIGTGTSNTQSGLYLAPDPGSLANNLYLRVRGNILDEATHIHFDTGNNQYFSQFIGDDNKYIQLANTGNIVINTNNYVGNTAQWNFGTDGTLTFPNGAVIRDTAGDAVAFGQQAGNTSQGNYAVALGFQAAITSQGTGAVAIGREAGNAQGAYAVAIGQEAGFSGQSSGAIAIGLEAGNNDQGGDSVAIGYRAGGENQDIYAVAIGYQAGNNTQGEFAVAIGYLAGNASQGNAAVAVGAGAGTNTQGVQAVAIGTDSGATSQGNRAVAIGYLAGSNAQGTAAVAIGYYAGELNQGNNSIIINATDTSLQQTTANTFTVAPVRNDVANVAQVMFYNTTSKEITYGNVISVAGNITGGNLSVTGNITGNTAGFAIGYRDIPQVSLSANATIATTDAGKHFYSTSASNLILTIANNASQGFQVGAAITIVNQGTGNITVAQGSGVTLYLAGNASSGNRTISTFGMATCIKVATDTWFINGTGVS